MHVCVVTDVDASSDDEKPVVAVDTWLTQAEVKMTFECQEVTSNGYTYPRLDLHVFLLVNICFCFQGSVTFGYFHCDHSHKKFDLAVIQSSVGDKRNQSLAVLTYGSSLLC